MHPAMETHRWFLKLLEMVTENGRQMTYPEEHVVGEIKKVGIVPSVAEYGPHPCLFVLGLAQRQRWQPV